MVLGQRADLWWQRQWLELRKRRGNDVGAQRVDGGPHRLGDSDLGGETDEEFGDVTVQVSIAGGDLGAVEVDDPCRLIVVDHHVGERKVAMSEAGTSEVEDLRPETGEHRWSEQLRVALVEPCAVDTRGDEIDRAALCRAEAKDCRDVCAGGRRNRRRERFMLDSALQTREWAFHL